MGCSWQMVSSVTVILPAKNYQFEPSPPFSPLKQASVGKQQENWLKSWLNDLTPSPIPFCMLPMQINCLSLIRTWQSHNYEASKRLIRPSSVFYCRKTKLLGALAFFCCMEGQAAGVQKPTILPWPVIRKRRLVFPSIAAGILSADFDLSHSNSAFSASKPSIFFYRYLLISLVPTCLSGSVLILFLNIWIPLASYFYFWFSRLICLKSSTVILSPYLLVLKARLMFLISSSS